MRSEAAAAPEKHQLDRQRWQILRRLERWLEGPMIALGFAWLALLIVEFTRGLSPLLEGVGTVIWGGFLFDFALKVTIAPRKGEFLRRNWLGALSLAVPALRVLRIARLVRVLRVARAARALRLVRVLSALNRGMRALGATMRRRGLGYVLAITAIVALAGAAGMLAFENEGEQRGFSGYGEALWWTVMLLTSIGSEYWPKTPEGRLLCLLLGLYGFAVFGYIAGALASYFVGRDAANKKAEVASEASLRELRAEIAALRKELRDGGARPTRPPASSSQ